MVRWVRLGGAKTRRFVRFARIRPRRTFLRGVAAQVEFESKILKQCITLELLGLTSRRFQLGFHRVNLHRPTVAWYPSFLPLHTALHFLLLVSQVTPLTQRRKLKLKVNVKSRSIL